MLVRLLVLGALLPATHAACGDYTNCKSCLTEEARSDGCFWCYTDRSCRQTGGIAPFITFSGCAAENVTFDAINCECRPDYYTSCSQCANAGHPSCVWIEPEFESQWDFEVISSNGATLRHSTEPVVYTKGRCWSGTGFGPTYTTLNTTVKVGSATASAQHTITTSSGWKWAQCTIPDAWMAIIIIAAMVLLIAIVFWFLYCCCCCSQKKR